MATWSNGSNARVAVSRKVVVSSLLLRVGISGVALAVWGAVVLARATTPATTAVAALLAGVAIAALALRKAWSMLRQDDEAGAPGATKPVSFRATGKLLLGS